MSTREQRAAFNVMCKLGVRTVRAKQHFYEPRAKGIPGARTPDETRALNERITALDATGKPMAEIAAELDVTKLTVWRHLTGKTKVAP